MRIAAIAWGSLVWRPGELQTRGRWRRDGPPLPVEFARRSKDGRLTLVLQASAAEQRTYWVLSKMDSLDAALENLRQREGTTPANIHWARGEQGDRQAGNDIDGRVRLWLEERADVDAAIWTGLPPTSPLDGANTVAEAVAYLEQLEGELLERAREYVVKTPAQIQTAVRREMQRSGWHDEELPSELFEPE